MAILSNGINGGFSGKAGAVVGYYRLGKWIIRGLPRQSAKNKRGSAGQRASRSVFTKVQYFLSPMLDFIRVGYNMEGRSRQMTAHNAAKSYHLLNAINSDGEIDFSKVLLCYGKLPGALNVQLSKTEQALHFTWDNNTNENGAQARDQVMLLAYDKMYSQHHPSVKAYYLLSGARRMAGSETLAIAPASKGHVLHAYIAFISDDRERISMSSYVGEIVF